MLGYAGEHDACYTEAQNSEQRNSSRMLCLSSIPNGGILTVERGSDFQLESRPCGINATDKGKGQSELIRGIGTLSDCTFLDAQHSDSPPMDYYSSGFTFGNPTHLFQHSPAHLAVGIQTRNPGFGGVAGTQFSI